MKRVASLLAIVVLLCSTALSQAQRGPSTAEERDRAVRIAEQLEANPLAVKAEDREWLVMWLIQIPDITVSVCSATMPWDKNYKFGGELVATQMGSSAAFIISHPERAKDTLAVQKAGFDSSLEAYEVLIQKDPSARSKQLDEMLAKRADGSLDAAITKKIKKECK